MNLSIIAGSGEGEHGRNHTGLPHPVTKQNLRNQLNLQTLQCPRPSELHLGSEQSQLTVMGFTRHTQRSVTKIITLAFL